MGRFPERNILQKLTQKKAIAWTLVLLKKLCLYLKHSNEEHPGSGAFVGELKCLRNK